MIKLPRQPTHFLPLLAALLVAGCTDAPTDDNDPPPPPLFDRIIFTRRLPVGCNLDCTYGLWTMASDGSDLKVLRDSLQYPESPAVSPDGSTVLFEDGGELYLMDAAGANLHRLRPQGTHDDYSPSWSPDGQWIYYMGSDTLGTAWQVQRIRADGTGHERLTTTPGQGGAHPAVSRDGHWLVYRANLHNVFPSVTWLVLRDLTTGVEQVLTDSAFHGVAGKWSPDGSSLLFLDSDPMFPPGWYQWRFTVATRQYVPFGESQGNRPATWSPDGTTLLFGTGDLWLADSSGQNRRVLLADSALNFEAYWTPASPP